MPATYDDIEDFEYLDLSQRKLGLKGIITVLEDATEDTMIKRINLCQNVSPDDVKKPSNMTLFFKDMKVNKVC